MPGTNVRLPVRKDAAGDLLMEVAAAWHRLIEPITGTADDWGYAERQIRGGTALSNHASGTAIDLNATKHPLGVRGTFTAAQRAQMQTIASVTGGVIRFGEMYVSRVDGMHVEVSDGKTLADCERALAAMRKFNSGVAPAPAPTKPAPATSGDLRRGSTGEPVKRLQRVLAAWYPDLRLVVDGDYGPATEAAVKRLQAAKRLAVDGIAGRATLGALGL